MLFKRLSDSDLQKLEKEFVEFLVLNGITADDWQKLKQEKPQNASKIVDSFSDTVYAGYMRNIKYLEHITAQEILCFYCQPTQIVLVGISTDQPIDFTKMESKSELGDWVNQLEVFTKTKPYAEAREIELFKMIENGAKPANEELFNLLCLAL